MAHAAALEARYLGTGTVTGAGIARLLAGVALKDSAEDATRLRYYVDTVVRERARSDARWREFLGAALALLPVLIEDGHGQFLEAEARLLDGKPGAQAPARVVLVADDQLHGRRPFLLPWPL